MLRRAKSYSTRGNAHRPQAVHAQATGVDALPTNHDRYLPSPTGHTVISKVDPGLSREPSMKVDLICDLALQTGG